MAYVKVSSNNPIISQQRRFSRNSSRSNKCSNLSQLSWRRSCKKVGFRGKIYENQRRFLEKQIRDVVLPSFSHSPVSSVQETGFLDDGKNWGTEKEFGNLVEEFGWKVRRLVEKDDEMRRVSQVQAEAFHIPMIIFDDLFFEFFKAEVLSGLVYKLRNSPPNRYACLVAESSDASESLPISENKLVGVVDVTALRDESVLKHLEGAEEYLYVSGIAVLKSFRRQKVATVLLKACDALSLLWGFNYLALRAYEDDMVARTLYTNAGYRVVSRDPLWMTSWIGRKRRVLMIKQSTLREWY